MRWRGWRLAIVAGVLALTVGAVVTVQLVGAQASREARLRAAARQQARDRAADRTRARDPRPNIVLVLMDDASYELLATMRNAQDMRRAGAAYVNSHVVDSLCCPSRAAILTGRPPHLTGVLTNTPQNEYDPIGGYKAFAKRGNAEKTFNLQLFRAGYTTGFIGKFLNGYSPQRLSTGKALAPAKQPGWSEFGAVLGGGYPEWGFWSTVQDQRTGMLKLVRTARPPRRSPVAVLDKYYATNVMADRAVGFLRRYRHSTKPYFLEVATYGPHAQMRRAYPDNPTFPSAFADRAALGRPASGNCGKPCGSLTLADLPGYGDPRADNRPTYLLRGGRTRPAPAWNNRRELLTPQGALVRYRDRARMVQSIDRMLGRIRRSVAPNTYVFFTSDNGFHLGQLRLGGGKGTPYDFDTRVPLLVTGPGVAPGARRQWVSNIDLAPTFEQLAGLRPPPYVAGTSFLPSLRDRAARGARYVFYDHTYAKPQAGEVDTDRASNGGIGTIPSYIAVRGSQGLLARFDLDKSARGRRYAWELYNYRDAPFERTNVFARDRAKPYARELMRRLLMWENCQPAQCRKARG